MRLFSAGASAGAYVMMNPSYVNAPAPCKPVIRASDEASVGGILGAAAGMAGGPILGKVAGAVLRGAAGAISKGLGAAGRAIQKAAGAGKLDNGLKKGITVIGHLPDYPKVAEKMGANYLKPSKDWNFQKQGEFIKDVIKRGDDVFIGTPIRQGPSVLKKEIKQLLKQGYRPKKQGSKWLIKE